jgi:hypothetical protein
MNNVTDNGNEVIGRSGGQGGGVEGAMEVDGGEEETEREEDAEVYVCMCVCVCVCVCVCKMRQIEYKYAIFLSKIKSVTRGVKG